MMMPFVVFLILPTRALDSIMQKIYDIKAFVLQFHSVQYVKLGKIQAKLDYHETLVFTNLVINMRNQSFSNDTRPPTLFF